jgi:hypothetical protein
MDPGFQAMVECMLEAGWTRGEVMGSPRRLIAADNMAQRKKLDANLAITRARLRAGREH